MAMISPTFIFIYNWLDTTSGNLLWLARLPLLPWNCACKFWFPRRGVDAPSNVHPPFSCLDGNTASIRRECDAALRLRCVTPSALWGVSKRMWALCEWTHSIMSEVISRCGTILSICVFLIFGESLSDPISTWRVSCKVYIVPFIGCHTSYIVNALYGAFYV